MTLNLPASRDTMIFMYQAKPLDELKPLYYALCSITGLGLSSSAQLLRSISIMPESSWADLSEAHRVALLQLLHQSSFRSKFSNTADLHVIGDRLKSSQMNAVRNLLRTGCYRGMRHRIGKRVRGQRTRTTGRTHKIIKGFQKKTPVK